MGSSSINYIFDDVSSEVRSTLSLISNITFDLHGVPTTIINYYYSPKTNNGYKHVQPKHNNLTSLMKFEGNLLKENHLSHRLIY